MAVANSVAAVHAGCVHVQGTMNGFGERCGNANLCTIIPNLQLKLGYHCVPEEHLKHLTNLSRFIYEIANIVPADNEPFVGKSAFAHKGGVHVSAVMKDSRTYEHIDPRMVGNHQRVLVSDLSGQSNVFYKANELGIELNGDKDLSKRIVEKLKKLEHEGYQYEGAEASFEILVRNAKGEQRHFFTLEGFRVIIEKDVNGEQRTEATIRLRINDKLEHTAADGDGPVNALDNALRKALEHHYPELKEMKLTDYKVRVIDSSRATEAKVRVLIESSNGEETWGTVGVSENIIEASWQALVDSISYHLLKRANVTTSLP
jgi:2-isopropylmalate synthase